MRIQGHGKLWNKVYEQKLVASKHISAASGKSVSTLGDLWCWEEERWVQQSKFEDEFKLPCSTAQVLVAAKDNLSQWAVTAMAKPVEIEKHNWYVHSKIFTDGLESVHTDRRVYLTSKMDRNRWVVH